MKRNRLVVALLLCCMLALAGCNKEEQVSSSKKTEEQVNDVQKTEEKDVVTALMDENLSKKEEKTDSKQVKPENVVVNTQKDPETKDVISESDPQVPFDISHPEVIENGEVEYSDDTIMVKFSKAFDGTVDEELKKAGVAKLEVMFELENATWYTAYLNKSAKVEDTLTSVRAYSKTIVAEYNFAYETTSNTSVDEAFNGAVNGNQLKDKQKVFHSCHIKDAWKHCHDKKQVGGGSSSVVVAVIDTGVDYEHVDLKANMWKNQSEIDGNNKDDDGNGYVDDYYGIDITARKGSAMDDNGHGTHVAGIIGASNNKEGVVGIAYNTKIMPIKAGDASGYFLQDNIAKAIIYAYEHGADVINMSFGGSAASIAVQDALAVAYSRCVLIASAGNDGMPNEVADYYPIPSPNYPAALSYVIGVMSTDFNDVESSFTNWDTTLYNSVEYEVYAPGNQILSTIPGDKYAELSGTSMASPVVAAQAAILRSFYSDTDTYPTKFIYGQIVGTADEVVKCLNPEKHTVGGYPHNIPGRVNFIRSIEELPTPDIGMSDYTIFDTENYVADTKGVTTGQLESNNGDGRIDSGEVIALGFTLKNRWGMSKDTVVHIDATTEAGVAHPYVTFLNNDINYESIGTYSESDSGKLYSEDGQMWTGWENPFYIKIDKDCPNEYTITLNISITYKNGLDESDRTTYTTKEKILLTVRRGTILPNKISEDMTLTKDNYYIIPNSMIVMEGATLTIEEGTKVQFWCSDPEDAYADTAITYINVAGKLISKGTEEEPVEMFPSEWMSRYRVEIKKTSTGYVSLEYTNVVNPYLTIDEAKNCEFTQNYKDYISYRELDNGQVKERYGYSDSKGKLKATSVVSCSFYKLGGTGQESYRAFFLEQGNYRNCIFVDSFIQYTVNNMEGCVFYGNNNYWDSQTKGGTSSFTLKNIDNTLTIQDIFKNTETGVTYIALTGTTNHDAAERFAKTLGGHVASFSSPEEFEYVMSRLSNSGYYNTGIYSKDGVLYNADGTVLDLTGADVTISSSAITYNRKISSAYRSLAIGSEQYNRRIIEIDGDINVTDIQLDEYITNIDMEMTYQIVANLTPYTADEATLVYESQDEAVVKVDKNGKVTPVGTGSTSVRVYSPDMAVYNYVTINVVDAVALESIAIREGDITLDINDTKKLHVDYTPANTTKRGVIFESSDESIVTVNEKGIITAVGEGTAIITASGYNNMTTSIKVQVIIPVEQVSYRDNVYTTTLTKDDGKAFYPTITPVTATNQELTWESSNSEVCYVNDEGKLVKLRNGSATLSATAEGTELSAELKIMISDELEHIDIVKMIGNATSPWILTSDGSLWKGGTIPKKISTPKIADICCKDSSLLLLIEDKVYNYSSSGVYDTPIITNVESIAGGPSNAFFVLKDGSVWGYGNNGCGQLGNETLVGTTIPTQMSINANVKKVISATYGTAILDEEGNLYICGNYYAQILKPQIIATGVLDIYECYSEQHFIYTTETYIYEYDTWGGYQSHSYKKTHENLMVNYRERYYIEDGEVYIRGSHNEYGEFGLGHEDDVSDFEKVLGITDAKKVFVFEDNIYIQTESGNLYATGRSGWIGNAGAGQTNIPTRVLFETYSNYDSLQIQNVNLQENVNSVPVLDKDKLVLEYNEALYSTSTYTNICLKDAQGNSIGIFKSLNLNKFEIAPLRTEFVDGETYTLTIPAGALKSAFGLLNESYELTFTYQATDEVETPGDDSEGKLEEEEIVKEVHTTIVDEEKLAQRHQWTNEEVMEYWNQFVKGGHNTRFYSNVILNRLNDDDTSTWLRITAPSGTATGDIMDGIGFGGNYWGTTNKELIEKQILDFDDYQSLLDINQGEILTEAPEDTFPFVVDAYLETNGERVDTVGNELVTFVVELNRDMDTSIDLRVCFGSAYPYADYTIEGSYATPRQWRGTMKLSTIIENGYQYWSVSNGKAAGTSMKLYTDWGRFPFKIDTSSAQALTMQAEATEAGIKLTWQQDDFETLAGYNVYRSTKEDGQYTKINRTVIPADTMEWFDDTVEPGQRYYYNFTVVQTDMSESEPSGKVTVSAFDTMAPNIYHSPVYHAFTGSNLVISATVTDNVALEEVTLYYRTLGTEEWHSKTMTNNNDKYSAVISSDYITVTGLEYYIDATDGIAHTYKGSAEAPYQVTVQVAVSGSDLGDVDGNGAIEIKDAMMLLMAINDRLNLTEEQFARADIDGNGELAAKEALRIIQYVNGTITSILM